MYSLKFLIIIPLLTLSIVVINYIVDPYNFNNNFNFNFNKKEISSDKFDRLWKMSNYNYKNKNANIILFGDSRTNALYNSYFNFPNARVYNLSYVGGSLYEIIDSFWFVTKQKTNINKIIFGIPFSMFNDSRNHNMVPESISLVENSYRYYLNRDTLSISFDLMFSNKVKNHAIEATWDTILYINSKSDYEKYRYPTYLIHELDKINEYCQKNNIEFIIFIPPSHVSLQNKVKEYNLTVEYMKYKDYLCTLSKVIDFDYKNNITTNNDNFIDPYHFNGNIAKKIIDEIFNDKETFSKRCDDI